MVDYASSRRTQTLILNTATTYYLAAVAVAIGFRMNLFNIGVDGQYRLAAMLSAALGGAIALPAPLHVTVIVVTAMLVGAMWAGIAGILRVTRGVSEVISTIMLNFIATGVVAYLLTEDNLGEAISGSSNIGTKPIPPSGQIPGFQLPGAPPASFVNGFIVVAVSRRHRLLVRDQPHPFRVRPADHRHERDSRGRERRQRQADGRHDDAAQRCGRRSGRHAAAARSVLHVLQDFPAGIGFTGIAVALLGRNHPVGIAIGALLFAFLSSSSQILDLNDVPKEIVAITQGVTVLSVVIAYELVRRYRVRALQREVGRQLATDRPTPQPEGVGA